MGGRLQLVAFQMGIKIMKEKLRKDPGVPGRRSRGWSHTVLPNTPIKRPGSEAEDAAWGVRDPRLLPVVLLWLVAVSCPILFPLQQQSSFPALAV